MTKSLATVKDPRDLRFMFLSVFVFLVFYSESTYLSYPQRDQTNNKVDRLRPPMKQPFVKEHISALVRIYEYTNTRDTSNHLLQARHVFNKVRFIT